MAVMLGDFAADFLHLVLGELLQQVGAGLLTQNDQQHGGLAQARQRLGFGFGGVEDHRFVGPTLRLFLPDPGAQDLRRDFRLLGDLLAQMFGQHFGGLGDDRREFQRIQRLRIELVLQGVALRQLGLDLLFDLVGAGFGRPARQFRGTGRLDRR